LHLICKLLISKGQVRFTTYIGGSSWDIPTDIALYYSAIGPTVAFMSGYTYSSDFPTTTGRNFSGGGNDFVFVAYSSSGERLLSTYFEASHISVDSQRQLLFFCGDSISGDVVTGSFTLGNSSQPNNITYLGLHSADYPYGCVSDKDGTLYIGMSAHQADQTLLSLNLQGKKYRIQHTNFFLGEVSLIHYSLPVNSTLFYLSIDSIFVIC
jgi:hypothetical protein